MNWPRVAGKVWDCSGVLPTSSVLCKIAFPCWVNFAQFLESCGLARGIGKTGTGVPGAGLFKVFAHRCAAAQGFVAGSSWRPSSRARELWTARPPFVSIRGTGTAVRVHLLGSCSRGSRPRWRGSWWAGTGASRPWGLPVAVPVRVRRLIVFAWALRSAAWNSGISARSWVNCRSWRDWSNRSGSWRSAMRYWLRHAL